MIDTVQLVLLLVIITLTILLVVLGIQVFHILKDIRKTLTKANHVLENAGSITDNISGPLESLSAITAGLRAGSFLTIARLVRTLLSKDDDDR